MQLLWTTTPTTFVIGGREYQLGGEKPVTVPDSIAGKIFGTTKWKDAAAKGFAQAVADGKPFALPHQPIETKAERLARKNAAAAAASPESPDPTASATSNEPDEG